VQTDTNNEHKKYSSQAKTKGWCGLFQYTVISSEL